MLLALLLLAAPGLVQYASSGMERNNSGTYTIHLPQPAQAGNLLVICLAADASATWNTPSDDKSGTWTAGPTLSTNQTVTMFYSMNAKGGASLLTAPCAGGNCTQAGHMQVAEFNNVATISQRSTRAGPVTPVPHRSPSRSPPPPTAISFSFAATTLPRRRPTSPPW
jgi:hypothetical protein